MKVYKYIKATPFASIGDIITEDQIKNLEGVSEYLEEVVNEYEIGQKYYSVVFGHYQAEIYENTYNGSKVDLAAIEFKNFFLNRSDAQVKLDAMKAILQAV